MMRLDKCTLPAREWTIENAESRIRYICVLGRHW